MERHKYFMKKCLEIAALGFPNACPNPLVGCIIVYNNEIIGKGYHKKYGEEHAEVNAINSVKNKKLLTKSILYVNLEPCSHHGKTPPCTDIIIKHKIPKVVIGSIDSFKKVCGNGIKTLKNSNIKVIHGILIEECKFLNKRFFTFHEKKRPYIILKWAKSQDNFIAPLKQKGKFWMTSNESKKIVHKWRSEENAILVGKNTVLKDDPLLTVRLYNGKNPIRIIINKKSDLSEKFNIFNKQAETIIYNESQSKVESNIIYKKIDFNNLLQNLLSDLYSKNIQSIIVEGGYITLSGFIKEELWDEARIFTTKQILVKGIKSPKITQITSNKIKLGDDELNIVYR